jgi:hypothetical protein
MVCGGSVAVGFDFLDEQATTEVQGWVLSKLRI